MKLKFVLALMAILLSQKGWMQKKAFNGQIKRSVKIESHCKGISEAQWKDCLFKDDQVIYYYNDSASICESNKCCDYYAKDLNNNFNWFYKYKGVDTLFYENDTSSFIAEKQFEFIPLDSLVMGFKCNKMVVKTSYSTEEYILLDSNLYTNGNKVVIKHKYTDGFYTKEESAISIEEKNIESSKFQLPNLPKRIYNSASLCKRSTYGESEDEKDWMQYLQSNLRARLGIKYIKIPKGEKMARQTVVVQFVIDSSGNVIKTEVLNRDKVHPKIAQEAVRVVNNCEPWNPALSDGKPIIFMIKQKITFQVNDDR